MTLDGITLNAIVQELRATLIGSRVQQIYEPDDGLLLLECYGGKDLSLLISTLENPRLHLTQQTFENPRVPPTFCMLLRKYLNNGYVIGVEQPGLERIVRIQIKHGDLYTLCVELIGQRSNVILTHDGKILGSLRKGTEKRPFSAGQAYALPPVQDKLSLLSLSQEELAQRLVGSLENNGLAKAVQSVLEGAGPRLAQELIARAQLDASQQSCTAEELERLWEKVEDLAQTVKRGAYQPHVYFEDERPSDSAPFALQTLAQVRAERRESISQAIDECTAIKHAENAFEKLSRSLKVVLKNKLKKVMEALEQVGEDLEKARGFETYREEGDLLMASLSLLSKGQTEIEVDDFQTGEKRRIELDPTKEPIENAQHKYERYKKLKRGVEKLAERQIEIDAECKYLQEIESHIEQAEDEATLQTIVNELATEGYIPAPKERRDDENVSEPREYRIQGYRIFVGRSSKQNDALVRNAGREDYWLHVRDRPGSHVVIRNPARRQVPPDVLLKAAQLAAYYSKGRNAGKVPVLYTLIKFLRKPKGARPGLVLVTQEEGTLVVSPSAQM
jgi:predicted ribosome quality control (RQC) complex YloA/Tae2 family protein